ncbi:hypothetical protein [Actinomadura macrotermitis]|uniref:Uncharacterized protein n=1 Tax=Actinomadura macrotermitis TaxID=2585200 RepID=A0A7K0C5B9_9ACTN|nr:hypothetical protein [Actinomadura macrotermitis]MQY08640.1 hypothetical protein [Actinomadura macrotermitis]
MAPPQFSMYSPNLPDGEEGDAAAEPVPGLGPQSDPGFAASLRSGTFLGQWRRTVLVLAVAPVLILAITPLIVQDGRGRLGDAPPWIYLPLLLAAVAAALIGPRVPAPLPPGLAPARAARTALLAFRQAVLVRFALGEGVILLGIPLAMVGHSELVFVAGFALGYPVLLWLTLPTAGAVERMRRRLEAGGAESHLWAALLSPVPRQPGG